MNETWDRPELVREAALAFPPEGRLPLLQVVVSAPQDRAGAIGGALAGHGRRQTAELLIDLEGERILALDVADALKRSLRD